MKNAARILGWLFDAVAVASLLLLIATAVMWARSYDREDNWNYTHSSRPLGHAAYLSIVDVWSSRGAIWISHSHGFDVGFHGPMGSRLAHRSLTSLDQDYVKIDVAAIAGGPGGWNRMGVHVQRDRDFTDVVVPYWLVVLALATVPFLEYRRVLSRQRRRYRKTHGSCHACEQNLRGTPIRCPCCQTPLPRMELMAEWHRRVMGWMTPLLGWTLSGMAAVSLLLCVALAVLWIRSDWRAEFWTYKGAMYGPRYRTSVQVNSVAGMAIIDYSGGADGPRAIGDEPSGFEHKKGGVVNRQIDQLLRSVLAQQAHIAIVSGWPCWNHLGSLVWMSSSSSVEIFLPYWQIVLVTGILPAFKSPNVWRWRRRKRRLSKGLCLACGYDLRATPQRCPECGTIVR